MASKVWEVRPVQKGFSGTRWKVQRRGTSRAVDSTRHRKKTAAVRKARRIAKRNNGRVAVKNQSHEIINTFEPR